MNKTLKRLAEPGVRMYLFFLIVFAAATVVFGLYELAIVEGVVILLLVVYTAVMRRKREKQLSAYIESVTYDTENAKNNTLTSFPLPIAVFRLDDSRIIWGNEMFFSLCGNQGTRLDARISDLVPQFSGRWLSEGKTQYPGLIEVAGKKYELRGNIVRSEKTDDDSAFMGITYWLDVTEYEAVRERYEDTRPVVGIIVIDNLDEMQRNQPERVKNDIRDAVEDKLEHWKQQHDAVIQRYDRDRYLLLLEDCNFEKVKEERFDILNAVHEVSSPNGITATVSIGVGQGAESFAEGLEYAEKAAELALSRSGDQAVVKKPNSPFDEFFGGRGSEVERRTKVRSRVQASSFANLVKESSMVFVIGHANGDLDSIGAAVGVCALARKLGVEAYVVVNEERCFASSLIEQTRQDEIYRDRFINPQEAMFRADGRTLLVVVDTSVPERVDDIPLLETCNRVVVIDHHRVGVRHIETASLSVIEPYASSTCELITEMLEEVTGLEGICKSEAEALLSGIVLDTKNFTLRTGERTFEAAAGLKRCGADTIAVKKLFQSGLEDMVKVYGILQKAEMHRDIAIAIQTEPEKRVIAAKAADELLNVSGVEASIVISADGNDGVQISARSIGELNVQLIMEKLGGGGNRSAAAAQFANTDVETARTKVIAAIDDYLEVKQ